MALTKWSDNKAASMLQGNYDGYIQSSLLQLRLTGAIGTNPSNGAAVYNIKENTTYKVRLYMDTRFRIAATSSIAMNTVMTNYYRDAADKSDTTVAGAYKEAEITSEAGQVYMPVIYWASGGSKTWQEVYDTIEVREQLSGALTLKSAPTKLEYNVGEEIDLTGLSVAVVWSDGSEETVADYTVSGFDSSAVGTKTVTVAYLGETVTFEVTIRMQGLIRIRVTALPVKTQYYLYETLDLSGLQVVADTDRGEESVTDYAVSGFDSRNPGNKTINVSYGGFATNFSVTVENKRKYACGEINTEAVAIVVDYDTNEAVVSGTGSMCGKVLHWTNCMGYSSTEGVKKVTVEPGVTIIGECSFIGFKDLIEVHLPDTVISIGEHAFRNCTALNGLIIPDTVSSIYEYAFYDSGLVSIDLPESVESIRENAFFRCKSLQTITIRCKTCNICDSKDTIYQSAVIYGHAGSTAEDYAIKYSRTFLTLGEITGIEIASLPTKISYSYGEVLDTAGMTVKANYSDGTSVDITDYSLSGYNAHMLGSQTVTVTYETFTDAFTVTVTNAITGIEVTPPAKLVYTIGESFDSTGMSVRAVWLDGTKTDITDYMVSGFDSNTVGTVTVTVMHQTFAGTFTVNVIESAAVKRYAMGDNVVGTLSLTTYELTVSGAGEMKTFTGADCYAETDPDFARIKTAGIEEGVTNVGAYAFAGCTELKSIELGSIISIGEYAFAGCASLDVLTLPALAGSVGEGAFISSGIRRLSIQSDAVTIHSNAFFGCTDLTAVHVTGAVENIHSNAFFGCTSLTEMELNGLVTLGDRAFYNTRIGSIKFPGTTQSVGQDIFQGNNLLRGIVFDGCSALAVGDYAFRELTGLQSVQGTAKSIGRMAFYNDAGLVVLDLSCETIGNQAFSGCGKLSRIVLKAPLMVIGDTAFGYCGGLTNVELPDTLLEIALGVFQQTNLESITLPEGIKKVGAYAFLGTSLKTITIPESVEELGATVFGDAASLTDIYILNGTLNIAGIHNGNSATLHGHPASATEVYAHDNSVPFAPVLEGITGVRITLLKDVYGIGEELDPNGLIVNLLSDGTVGTKLIYYDISGFDNASYGSHTLTISYYGLSGTITVTVRKLIVRFFVGEKVLKEEEIDYLQDAAPPVMPELTGFMFSGWDGDYTAVTEDRDLRGDYTILMYTVTWKDHDGTVLRTETMRYGDDATPPADPTREGYLFAGWDKPYLDITADTIITAAYVADVKVTSIQISDIEIKNSGLLMLPYTVLPDNATNRSVSFESGDESIASIGEDGTLQANNAGSTTITISAKDGSGVKATCTVTVIADTEVTSLWLIPNDFYLQIGKTAAVAADIIAGDDADTALLWTSSDTGVATVDKNGKVKGVAVGKTTITARLKTDASIFAVSNVDVIAKEDYIRELYADDSVHKETVIHSVDGKFDDITNADIKAESMMIKEAVCGSAPAYLGGCISNSFEILVHTKRFFNRAPSGEIQVYQKVGGVKVNLFHGVIDSAKKQDDRITRKLIAYDKMHTAGDVNISSWFKKQKFPITVGTFRKKLFKKIGISHQGVKLTCDDFKIFKNYAYYTDSNEDIPDIDVVNKTDRRHDLYSVPDTLKAIDVIRDICEVSGRWGWMNRTGTFEYVDPYVFDLDYITGEKEKKYLHPIKIQDDNKSYAVKAVELYLDDKEIDPLVYVWGGGSYSNKRKYSLDDSNFIVSATRGAWMSPKNYNTCEMAIVEELAKTMHDKNWVSFSCTQRFDPTIKIGTDIYYENVKKLSDGTSYKWTTYSAVLERTIKGCQSMLETVSASVGPLSSGSNKKKKTVDKTKKTEKVVSDLKQEVSSLGIDYYGSGGGSGGGLKAVSVTELPADPDSNTIYLIQGEVTVE